MAKKRVKAGTSKAKAAERKAKFIEEYIKNGGNATQAAIKAGYSEKRARATGSEFVADRDIADQLSKRAKQVAAITGLDTERTAREIARIAYSDPRRFYTPEGNFIPIHELDDDVAATIASIEHEEIWDGRGEDREQTGLLKKLKIWDKNSALEKAARIHGLYKEDNTQKGDAAIAALMAAVSGNVSNKPEIKT